RRGCRAPVEKSSPRRFYSLRSDVRPTGWAARRSRGGSAFLLADSLEGAVLLDLVDPVSGGKLHLAALLEPDREPEDRGLQVRLRDLLPHRSAGRLAVTGLARPGDGPNDDLRRHVRRQSEELAVAAVRLHIGLNDLTRRVVRERRVVRPRDLPDAGSEQTVRAEQLDVALAGCLQLLAERLGLRSELPGDVDALVVRRDLRDR